MKNFIKDVGQLIYKNVQNKFLFTVSFVFFIIFAFFQILHYTDFYYENNLSWIVWILSVGFFSYSFFLPSFSLHTFFKCHKKELFLLLFATLLYWISHLWNFQTAPWSQNGLFDDAAWDIYFAKNHVLTGPIQPAFFDEVGYISREVVFHYYISFFFLLFGYNLLTFNISLLFLGFITVLFTTLLIHVYFKNVYLTFICLIVLNFFPLHYMHVFMGHRYAIAAPLMMVSLFFLYAGFLKRSFFYITLAALFAAFCWGSAIMGKQYVIALFGGAILSIFLGGKAMRSKEKLSLGVIWFLSFIFAATPLILYILFNYQEYTLREKGLVEEFFHQYKIGGISALNPYATQITELYFSEHSFARQFLSDFYIIPVPYYVLLIPGLCIAIFKKRFEIAILAVLPTIAAFISGAYDFRVLLSVPIWVILFAFVLSLFFSLRKKMIQMNGVGLSILIILLGLIPSISYINTVSKNPNHIYLLPHKDVAVSRLVQDVVAGDPSPTKDMKHDEFNRSYSLELPYETFVCPATAYAIMHLYLKDFDDRKVLSFCDQGIQLLKTPEEIFQNNKDTIVNYQPSGKDVKFIWEISYNSQTIIKTFQTYERYGSGFEVSDTIDGTSFSLYILTIKNENIEKFKNDVSRVSLDL